MNELFTLSADPNGHEAVEEWLSSEPQTLFAIARIWFDQFRDCGPDVDCLLHDGCPTACVNEAAIGYVNVFRHHVNVGFFTGAFLNDPDLLLEGSGKRMRHVKLRPGQAVDEKALKRLIADAYQDVKKRISTP